VQEAKGIVESDLINSRNMGYDGEFYFGNPSQRMSVVFDTGSANAWLFSEHCREGGCPAKNKKFEASKSKDYQVNAAGSQMLRYGVGAVKGHPSVDRAFFDNSGTHCIPHLGFVTVEDSEDLEVLRGSGLIGIGPSPELYQNQSLDDPLEAGVSGFLA